MLKLLNDLKIINGIQLKKEEQAAKICTTYWKCLIFDDDDDDDKESSIPLKDIIPELPLSITITPDFPITDSLIIRDEHLNTIPKTESEEENKSSVEDLNLTPSESEDLSDIESECDMPFCDDFMTFSNPLFDSNNDFTFSDDVSLSDEDVPKENFKIYSNPLFDEEIISTKIDPHHFNAESDLMESLLNRDTSIVSSPKFDSLLEEFSGELAHINLISPEIDEVDFDPEEEIRLVEKLLYDNSSPRPPEELNSENSDAVIKSFSPSPIPFEDSDSLMEEIDIFLAPDDSIPSSIENDDWNGYLRKGRKTKPKRQNRTRNGKAGKDKVKVQAKVNRSQPKSNPVKPQRPKVRKFNPSNSVLCESCGNGCSLLDILDPSFVSGPMPTRLLPLLELLQSFLRNYKSLMEIQPLKQETPNQIQKDLAIEKSLLRNLLAVEMTSKDNQDLK
ncbi:hypothetical protein Tco_0296440 [Tanacetum coccineum]